MNQIKLQIRGVQRRILDSIVSSNPRIGLDRRADFFTGIFENYLPRESRVLDIGGGWGFYGEPLTRRGHKVTVLDVCRPGYQKEPVVIYGGSRIPFADASFDASCLITVLHHCADPAAVIKEAKRVTKKVLIVVEDLYRHSLGRWWTKTRDQILNFEYFGHPDQFRTAEEWIEMIQDSGFRLKRRRDVTTWLSGFRILNGVLIFEAH